MIGTPTVEPVETNDRRGLRAAVDLLASSLPDQCRGLAAYDAARYDAYLAATQVPRAGHRTLVLRAVRLDGRVRAVADWRMMNAVLFLNGLAVAEADRCRGLGGLLLRDGVALAVASGARQLALDVSIDNTVAQALYRKWGFEQTGRSAWVDVTDTAGCDVVGAGLRITDWPTFSAHHMAYGFGDLTLREDDGQMSSVRVVGDVLRIPPSLSAQGAATVSALLSPRRTYLVSARPSATPNAIAAFARLARTCNPAEGRSP